MRYAVKELFYTLQGEGANSGRAAVFLRFAGCNLWSGRERDRANGPGGCSRWCDTDFVGTTGVRGGVYETGRQLAKEASKCWPTNSSGSQRLVVCTGGEPLLQLDAELVEELHGEGFEVAVETNGTLEAPDGIDWICVSPKAGGKLQLRRGHELKFVFPQNGLRPEEVVHLPFTHFWLQPMDGPNRAENQRLAVDYCLSHPAWRLSMQMHKVVGIP